MEKETRLQFRTTAAEKARFSAAAKKAGVSETAIGSAMVTAVCQSIELHGELRLPITVAPGANLSISLLDHFAGHALQGAIANGALEHIADEVREQDNTLGLAGLAKVTKGLLARIVYDIAESIFAERQSRNGGQS